MRTSDRPQALSEIAEEAGFSRSDVALVSGLEESTISRLWSDPAWLDRVTGSSLQKLIASVPGVADYVTSFSLADRLSRLIHGLADEGLVVNEEALRSCRVDGIPEPYVGNALEAALHTMRADVPKVVPYLARFWGRDQDRALERLYSRQEGDGLLANPDILLSASVDLAPLVVRKGYSFHSILAQATLVHHAARDTDIDPEIWTSAADRRGAFILRSRVMGQLIDHDDRDLAEKYDRMVTDSGVLTLIEEWSFPTYTRDSRPDSDFAMPRSLLLRNTSREVVREIGEYGEAYVHYLLTTYVPLALRRDPTFGLNLDKVVAAVRERLDRTDDRTMRALCEKTLHDLDGEPDD
jgi:hypothetical protein